MLFLCGSSVSQSLSISPSLPPVTSTVADLEISLLAGDEPPSLLDFMLRSIGSSCTGDTLGVGFSISSGVGALCDCKIASKYTLLLKASTPGLKLCKSLLLLAGWRRPV